MRVEGCLPRKQFRVWEAVLCVLRHTWATIHLGIQSGYRPTPSAQDPWFLTHADLNQPELFHCVQALSSFKTPNCVKATFP